MSKINLKKDVSNKNKISNNFNDNKSNTKDETKQKRGASFYIRWYLCACSILSGIAWLGFGRIMTGGILFIGGIIICPALFKEKSIGIRVFIWIITFCIGIALMVNNPITS